MKYLLALIFIAAFSQNTFASDGKIEIFEELSSLIEEYTYIENANEKLLRAQTKLSYKNSDVCDAVFVRIVETKTEIKKYQSELSFRNEVTRRDSYENENTILFLPERDKGATQKYFKLKNFDFSEEGEFLKEIELIGYNIFLNNSSMKEKIKGLIFELSKACKLN